jgi:hypothetical protein
MIKKHITLLLFIASCQVFSQQIYLNTGKNFTKYDYRSSDGQSSSLLQAGTGNYYEVGVAIPFTDEHIIYSVSLSLNEYNAVGGNAATSYRWDTKYLGIKGGLGYSFFPNGNSLNNNLDFLLNLGLVGESVIYGKQQTDGIYYDLVSNNEFSGLLLGSSFGCQVKYQIPAFGFLSLDYNFGHRFNVSNSSEEQLSFSTHQIGLGFHFPIN